MPSPSSSSSPSSSTSQPLTPQRPLPLTRAYLYDTYRPGELHLVPCTVDQYFELPFGNEDKYELVEGILWWKGEMLTHKHDEARDRIAAEISRGHGDQGYEVVTERNVDASQSSNRTSYRSRLRSASSSSNQRHSTIRRPDIAVFEPSLAPNRDSLSPKSKKITFPHDHPPLLAIEVTSPSTRNVDLTSKWDEYEGAGVKFYVIVDRANETDQSVIVGTLSGNGTYVKRVYRGNDVVHGSLFSQLEFSAQYWLDPPRSITEIRNSPLKKLKSRNRDLERGIADEKQKSRDKDRKIADERQKNRDKDRKIADERQKNRAKDREIAELKRHLANVRERKESSGNAHGHTEKQGGSSSSPKSPASKGGSSSKGNSPSTSRKDKNSK